MTFPMIPTPALRLGLLLVLLVGPAAGAAALGQPRPLDQVLPDDGPWQIWEVSRNGLSKKVRFELRTGDDDGERAAGDRATVMKYKGLPVSWGSPLELVVDRDRYAKDKHRVKYRFEHPTSGRALVLWARSTVHSVRTIPIRDDDSQPRIEVLDAETRESVGQLTYHWQSTRVFDGEIAGREVVVERLGEKPRFEKGVLGYLLAPYPILGEYAVWIDGEVEAVFVQRPQRGFRSPFELALRLDPEGGTDDDAVLAFVVFDLMKVFVESAS